MDPGRTFLYLGHFLPSKGIGVLLKAFAALDDESSRLVLAWSGIGDAGDVARRIDRLGLKGRVRVLSSPVHRSTFLAAGCALVLPYPFSYGQTAPPVALLEAFRAGVPVVVSGFGSLQALGGDETMLSARPGDWRDLAGKMRRVLAEPGQGAGMRSAQKALFAKLDKSFDARRIYGGR
jgi:glycosyltransferase involved in cell wall biosynthesis